MGLLTLCVFFPLGAMVLQALETVGIFAGRDGEKIMGLVSENLPFWSQLTHSFTGREILASVNPSDPCCLLSEPLWRPLHVPLLINRPNSDINTTWLVKGPHLMPLFTREGEERHVALGTPSPPDFFAALVRETRSPLKLHTSPEVLEPPPYFSEPP